MSCSYPLFNPVKAQSWQDTVTIINKLFDRYLPDHPGCQLAISRDGQIIYSKAWGLADIERNVPYNTETVTEAGSISKEFTAATILILEHSPDKHFFISGVFYYTFIFPCRRILNPVNYLRSYYRLVGTR